MTKLGRNNKNTKPTHDPQQPEPDAELEPDAGEWVNPLVKGEVEAANNRNPMVKVKVEILDDGTMVQGHMLEGGTIIELDPRDLTHYRAHGMRFGDVKEDDSRSVKDIHRQITHSEDQDK